MKKFLSIVAVCAMMFGMVACEDIEDGDGSLELGDDMFCLESLSYNGGDISLEYVYDEDMNIVQIKDGSSDLLNFSYTSGGAVVEDEDGRFAYVLTFNGSGYVSKIVYYEGDYSGGKSTLYSTKTYTYDGDGYLSKSVLTFNSSGYSITTAYTWEDENLLYVDVSEPEGYTRDEFKAGPAKTPDSNFDPNFFAIAEEFTLFPSVWFGRLTDNLASTRLCYTKSSASAEWELTAPEDGFALTYGFNMNGCVTYLKESSEFGVYGYSLSYVETQEEAEE